MKNKDLMFSKIGENIIENPVPQELLTSDEMEMNRVKTDYNLELNSRKRELTQKISSLETKLKKHELKEGMLDRIISQTYTEMDNLTDNQFSLRGQKQSILIKQMEALSILHDTILKYEGMIQAYHKILLDIENNKLNSYIKIVNLKKEESTVDEGIGTIMTELQEMLRQSSGSGPTGSPILDDIKQELSEGDY